MGPTTLMTTSTPPSACRRRRNRSRMMRLIRFLAWARATAFFPTIRPNRAACILVKTAFRRNGPALSLTSGRRRTASNSLARVSRACLGKLSSTDVRGKTNKPQRWKKSKGVESACDQTLRRLRPLARRALRTLRPPLVAMRARKPWVRLRFRLLGWNVRFMRSPGFRLEFPSDFAPESFPVPEAKRPRSLAGPGQKGARF